MKNNENSTSSKVVYAVLGLSLLGQGTYIYKQSGDTREIKAQIEDSNRERSQILAELTKLNSSRDSILNQNTIITKELIAEREKVVNMIDELNKSKSQVKKLQNSLFACKELERNNAIAKNVFSANNAIANSNNAEKKSKANSELKEKKEILKRKKDSLDNKIKADKTKLLVELKRKSDVLKSKKDSIDKKIKADNERLLVELKKNNADLKEKQALKEKELVADKSNLKDKEKELAADKSNLKEKEKELVVDKSNLKEKQDLLDKEKKAEEELAKTKELARIKKEIADKERYAAAVAVADKAKKDAEVKKADLAAKESVIEAAKKADVIAATKKVEVLNPGESRLAADEKSKITKNPANLEKLTKINIQELKSIGIKSATEDDEEIETILAADINVLRVSFTIPQNFVVRASERNYFIQVLDSKGNLVGENATVIFEDDSRLAYTFSTKVKYKNKALNVVENMYYKNFKKGSYSVKVYDKSALVSETSFLLR